jgi:hypothetical protein
VKISVEPMSGFSFNVKEGTSEEVAGIRVEWQAVKGGKRAHTNIVMESEEPADMLRAAAAYFESEHALPF